MAQADFRTDNGIVSPMSFKHLADCSGLVHGVLSRAGGVSDPPYHGLNLGFNCGDKVENVIENRNRMLGALGLFISSFIRQLENFAGVMNFVIFPTFFMSSALYPLWKMQEASEVLYFLCLYNPFSYCVELIRHALYGQLNVEALLVVSACTLVFSVLAVVIFNPQRGFSRGSGKG